MCVPRHIALVVGCEYQIRHPAGQLARHGNRRKFHSCLQCCGFGKRFPIRGGTVWGWLGCLLGCVPCSHRLHACPHEPGTTRTPRQTIRVHGGVGGSSRRVCGRCRCLSSVLAGFADTRPDIRGEVQCIHHFPCLPLLWYDYFHEHLPHNARPRLSRMSIFLTMRGLGYHA
jgi:hypothetical protein